MTAPVNAFVAVTARWVEVGDDTSPTDRPKTRRALCELIERKRLPERLLADIELRFSGDLRVGKGMASSTADIVAACVAVAGLLDIPLHCDEIAEIALSVEPTDGVFYPGVVAFDHRGGGFLERLGSMPPLDVLVLDAGGQIDTVSYNSSLVSYSRDESKALLEALELLRTGISMSEPRMVGEACTISARLNQRRLPKPRLEAVIEAGREQGAYGVLVAHSGTLIGVLVEPSDSEMIACFKGRFAGLSPLGRLSLTNGGFAGFEDSQYGYNSSNVMVTSKQ